MVIIAKSKRTKALEIPIEVKKAVAERDSIDGWACCIYCGKPAPTENPLAFSNAHILRRSRGGKGIVTNIVTLCWNCHMLFDESDEGEKITNFITEHMKRHHGEDWNIQEQAYQKGE